MLTGVPAPALAGAAAASGALVLTMLVILLVRHHRRAEPVHLADPRPAFRIITDPEELADWSRRAADDDYRQAMRLMLRGARKEANGSDGDPFVRQGIASLRVEPPPDKEEAPTR